MNVTYNQALTAQAILNEMIQRNPFATMSSSAKVCLEDSVKCFEREMYGYATNRAFDGIRYFGEPAHQKARQFVEEGQDPLDLFEDDEIEQAAAEAVEWMFGDWPEDEGIGSSDVSACVAEAVKSMGLDYDQMRYCCPEFVTVMRNAVHDAMSETL